MSGETVEVKEFFSSPDSRVERVLKSPVAVNTMSVKLSDIKGYVTAKYDGRWWLGCVIQTFAEANEVEVNFLHPYGPATSYRYPHSADILVMSCQDVLTIAVQPSTSTGRTYLLTAAETDAANTALLNHLD